MAERFIPRIDGFAIDAIENEQHDRESDITQIPVEKGSDVTDNVTLKNRACSIQGIVTDTPNGDMLDERGGFFDAGLPGQVLPASAACSLLEEIWESKRQVTVETEFKTYKAMTIKSLQMPRDSKTGRALRFTVKFEEMRIRETTRKVILLREEVRMATQKKRGQLAVKPQGPALKSGPVQGVQIRGKFLEARAAGYKGTEEDFVIDGFVNRKKQGVPDAVNQRILGEDLHEEAVHKIVQKPLDVFDNTTGKVIFGVLGGPGIIPMYKNEFTDLLDD